MKPYVICHMCTTIDGRIMVDRWPRIPGRKSGASLFESTADSFGIGAWLVGTRTMSAFAGRKVKLKSAGRRIERTDHIADRKARRFAIGTDAKGALRFQRGDVDGDHVVLLVTTQERLRRLKTGATRPRTPSTVRGDTCRRWPRPGDCGRG